MTGRRFVVVTGSPRSGTTGVGGALGHAPGAHYLYEPLNPLSGLRSVEEYFLFPTTAAEAAAVDASLDQVQRLSLAVRSGIWSTDPRWRRSIKRVTGSRSRVSAVRCRLDPRARTVVWKDPFAAFLAARIRERHALPVVVTVRPPEGVAASFKRLGWGFPLERLVAGLRTAHPQSAHLEIEPEVWAQREDPVVNAALLWRLIYGHLVETLPAPGAENGGPPVRWANNRVLLEDPLGTYADLFDACGLSLDQRSRDAIAETYRDEGSTDLSTTRAHDADRNVQQANAYWSKTLTPDEQGLVASVSADVRALVEHRSGPLA